MLTSLSPSLPCAAALWRLFPVAPSPVAASPPWTTKTVAINSGNNLQALGMQQLEIKLLDDQDKANAELKAKGLPPLPLSDAEGG